MRSTLLILPFVVFLASGVALNAQAEPDLNQFEDALIWPQFVVGPVGQLSFDAELTLSNTNSDHSWSGAIWVYQGEFQPATVRMLSGGITVESNVQPISLSPQGSRLIQFELPGTGADLVKGYLILSTESASSSASISDLATAFSYNLRNSDGEVIDRIPVQPTRPGFLFRTPLTLREKTNGSLGLSGGLAVVAFDQEGTPIEITAFNQPGVNPLSSLELYGHRDFGAFEGSDPIELPASLIEISSEGAPIAVTSLDFAQAPLTRAGEVQIAGKQVNRIHAVEALKTRCAQDSSDVSLFYQDFSQEEQVEQVGAETDNQWRVGDHRWWFPQGRRPTIQGDYLVLTSAKITDEVVCPASPMGSKEEAQSLEVGEGEFALPDKGEFIVALFSSRWAAVPSLDDNYWADTSACLEFFGPTHYGICFTYGSFGVFADSTGRCKSPELGNGDPTCGWVAVDRWESSAELLTPVVLRISWETDDDGARTFLFRINEDLSPRASIAEVNYFDADRLRIRLNANVTDLCRTDPATQLLPHMDADILYVDYVCLRNLDDNR